MASFDQVPWDSVYRSNFQSTAFSEALWIGKALDLYQSARRLEPAIENVWNSYRARGENRSGPVEPDHYSGPYFMLISYAVENLLKAAAVSRNTHTYREYFQSTGKFPDELKSHDLMKLGKLLDLTITQEEESLLRRLTRSAVWFGRYPAPLKYPGMSGVEQFNNGKEYQVSWLGREDVSKLRAFIDGLPDRLSLPVKYWKSTG